MTVRVKLFALVAQLAAADEIEVRLDVGVSIGDLRKALANQYPALAAIMPHLLFAVNSAYATDPTLIPEGAEIACIPPVSGG